MGAWDGASSRIRGVPECAATNFIRRLTVRLRVALTFAVMLHGFGAVPGHAEKPVPAIGNSDDHAAALSRERERALKPGDIFKECDNCPEMVVVPAGSFTMGSPASERGHSPRENPQHSVTLAKPFAVGRFAVTFDEWDACVAGGGCDGYKPADRWGRGRQPVIEVSWTDTKTYVAWLSHKTGTPYRLPSEAEREYVTRAGTTTPYWWGASVGTDLTNIILQSKTVPVDSLEPNPFGLYLVAANVSEWVEDCWHDSYTGAPSDGSAWLSGDCRHRVLRGSSYLDYYPEFHRSARRQQAIDGRGEDGFRVARALTP
jgi:formylglycine-generating enzyme required for sulfatase activity